MLKVLVLFLLLLAGVVLGPMVAGHQGYVLIQTDNWNIETSVTGLGIILILSLLVILLAEWILPGDYPDPEPAGDSAGRVDPAPSVPHRRPHARLVHRP